MCTVISILTNKGGVGKTTSTSFLAQLLAFLQKRTLCVDLDESSNLSMALSQYIADSPGVLAGIEDPVRLNIADLFKYRYREKAFVKNIIYPTPIPNLDIIPASHRHKGTPTILSTNQTGNNNIVLRKALATIKDEYDYILIDSAPVSDILTVNSMFASDLIFIPVRLEEFSHAGLLETIRVLNEIKEDHDMISLKIGGAFFTQVEDNTNLFKRFSEKADRNIFLNSHIRKDIKVGEVNSNFRPILEYCPNTNAVFDYANLLLEMGILDEASKCTLKSCIS